jgi:predicted GTPase
MPLLISAKVRDKLRTASHAVSEDEIIECFANRDGRSCLDTREEHRTDPATQWFVAQTDRGRRLKICYVFDERTAIVEIKTAYAATSEIQRIYDKYAR